MSDIDIISCVKASATFTRTVFIGLRSLDIFLQRILAKGTGDPVLKQLTAATPTSTIHPSRFQPILVLVMAASSAVTQMYWEMYIANEEIPPASAMIMSIGTSMRTILGTLCSHYHSMKRAQLAAPPALQMIEQGPALVLT